MTYPIDFVAAELDGPPEVTSTPSYRRPQIRGKFIYLGREKFYVRGVTYGVFRPNNGGNRYPRPEVVEDDFALMAESGANALRTYSVPPGWLLDRAQQYGLRVMVGLPLERYIGFLIDSEDAPDIENLVREGVSACAGHPAILCYAIGNEVPASIVRWHGRRRIEGLIEQLVRAVKSEDPDALVTYVNYAGTEHLRLPFLDFDCFNVYLRSQERFEAYLARLQNIAGDRPLVMSELGADSARGGEAAQAYTLEWQIRTAFAGGCAGSFVRSWTDDCHQPNLDPQDCASGLTRPDRSPKLALATVEKVFGEVPFSPEVNWPHVSVVVCSFNGESTIGQCLQALEKLDYPSYEVIVVDDGSTDNTAAIAREFDNLVISTEQSGLSNARNTGLKAATGEIVAYVDDDAYPDPQWLTYLAATFKSTNHAGVGGPNIAPPGDGFVAEVVDRAPGNPTHVLLSDMEAEHIPGCNMAFRKERLEAIGGFDPFYRVAGDDVDVCWRLRQRGWTLGFSPAAMVWHHRRKSIRAYWKQQIGYGKAEALLESKWPEKYNAIGHLTWAGRIYNKGFVPILGRGGRIYQGISGRAQSRSIYEPASGVYGSLPLMPEWFLFVCILAILSVLGLVWAPLFLAAPLLFLAGGASFALAFRSALRVFPHDAGRKRLQRLKFLGLTTSLYLLQPLGRLYGRLQYGLTPWRRRHIDGFSLPRNWTTAFWIENGQSPEMWLEEIRASIHEDGGLVLSGGDFDRWDLEVRSGLATARLLMAVEEHGQGSQMVRFRVWPRWSRGALMLIVIPTLLASAAVLDRAWPMAILFGIPALLLALRSLDDSASAMAGAQRAVKNSVGETDSMLLSFEQSG
jgi:GT2 family glycosyltransferase